jgi:hypothetical protein
MGEKQAATVLFLIFCSHFAAISPKVPAAVFLFGDIRQLGGAVVV